MSTLDLIAPGATPANLSRGLTAAGDVIRTSGMLPEIVDAGRHLVCEHRAGRFALPAESWHWRAAQVFEDAQQATLQACFSLGAIAEGSELLIVKCHGPASLLDSRPGLPIAASSHRATRRIP